MPIEEWDGGAAGRGAAWTYYVEDEESIGGVAEERIFVRVCSVGGAVLKCLRAAWLVMNRAWMHEGMMSLALTLARAQQTPALVSTAFCAFNHHVFCSACLEPCAAQRPPKMRPGHKSPLLGLVHRRSIDEYTVKTATLRLKHNYPVLADPVIAYLDIEHVLERAKNSDVDVGTWLNVIGYVQQTKHKAVSVQAVLIWDAGNVDLEAYQSAIQARKAAS